MKLLPFYINSFVFNEKYSTISNPINIHYISETDSVSTTQFIKIKSAFMVAILEHMHISVTLSKMPTF